MPTTAEKKFLVNVVCECNSEAGTEDETFNRKFFTLITDSCWDVIFAEVLQFLFLSTSIFALSSLHLSMGPVSEESLWCWWWTCSASESILLFLCESTCWSHSLLLLFPIHSLCFLDLISSHEKKHQSLLPEKGVEQEMIHEKSREKSRVHSTSQTFPGIPFAASSRQRLTTWEDSFAPGSSLSLPTLEYHVALLLLFRLRKKGLDGFQFLVSLFY